MDTDKMTIDEIRCAVTLWAADEPLVRRVYLFGSRAKGTHRHDSDVDLAVLHEADPELLPPCCESSAMARHCTWDDYGADWTKALAGLLTAQVHVQPASRTDTQIIWPALKECRICLYRRSTRD